VLLTAIIFAQESSRFYELLVSSSRTGAPLKGLWRVLSALIPNILVITLPVSLLIGTLVGLGRLSGDSEIIAMGASGISRTQILRPIIALALLVSAVMVYLTFNVMPRAISNLRNLKANQSLIFQGFKANIKPRVFDESVPHKVIYIQEVDKADGNWRNIFLVDLGDGQEDPKLFTATSGSLKQGATPDAPSELQLGQAAIHQLNRQNQQVPKEKRKGQPQTQDSYTLSYSQQMVIPLAYSKEDTAENMALGGPQNTVTEMTWNELLSYSPHATDILAWKAEIQERIAFPAACLVFAILAVAFGISNVRTGRPLGLVLGLAVTIVYYLLQLSGRHWASSGKVPPWLGIWAANIVLASIGISALLIQRRPGVDVLSAIGRLRHLRRPREESDVAGSGEIDNESATTGASSSVRRLSTSGRTRTGRLSTGLYRKGLLKLHQHQLVDRMVLSDLARFFLFILGGFSALFLIITVFQLLDQITRNNIEATIVASYLFFLVPFIVNYMAPMAILVAVMVTFGLLEKTSQIVVLKASGISIFRLAAPALLCSLLLSTVVFLNQDYILPFTNRRQDNLLHLIRSGQEPPQTSFQTDHKWIVGANSRIYNYEHFSPMDNGFARLRILDFSREPFAISRHLFAERARWDAATDSWVLEDGWERRFDGGRQTFEPFDQRAMNWPERPEYFKKDVRESQMMTLQELRRHIADLAQSGFNVLDLRIDLYRKVAFPVTCVVMMFVGLPFAFSVGKRGALYGVTIGIAIGLFYWGLLNLFEQMGRYEVLPAWLAAWGPNLMFGAGGLYLFLTSRT
jgi:LPS export ABC transporter permease LptG/LPS export ABC transporter permease LptF